MIGAGGFGVSVARGAGGNVCEFGCDGFGVAGCGGLWNHDIDLRAFGQGKLADGAENSAFVYGWDRGGHDSPPVWRLISHTDCNTQTSDKEHAAWRIGESGIIRPVISI